MSHEYTIHIHTWIMSGWVIHRMLFFVSLTPGKFNIAPEKWWLEDDPFLSEPGNFSGANSLLNFRWVNQNPIYHLPTTTTPTTTTTTTPTTTTTTPTTTGPEFSSLFNLGVTLSHFVASIHALQILSLQPGVFGSDSCGWPAIPPDVPGVLGMFFFESKYRTSRGVWMSRFFESSLLSVRITSLGGSPPPPPPPPFLFPSLLLSSSIFSSSPPAPPPPPPLLLRYFSPSSPSSP